MVKWPDVPVLIELTLNDPRYNDSRVVRFSVSDWCCDSREVRFRVSDWCDVL